MKKLGMIIAFLLVLACAFNLISSAGTANGQDEIKVICGDKAVSFDTEPRIVNGKIFVPFRNIFEALDAQVVWDEKNKKIQASTDQSNLEIFLDKNTAQINGDSISLSESDQPIVEKDRILVPLRFVSEALYAQVSWDAEKKTVVIEKGKLPVVGTYQNLKKLLETSENWQSNMYFGMAKNAAAMGDAEAPTRSEAEADSDYSTTNIQVQGVDEGDVIKTDGKYIYQVNNGRVVIALAAPAEKMAVTDTLLFAEKKFSPQELYVDDRYLVVIGSSHENRIMEQPKASGEVKIYPPVPVSNTVKAVVFDIRNKNDIKQVREVELEGNYISSRKVGNKLYLAANKYLDYYHIMEYQESAEFLPLYRDTQTKNDYIAIPYPDICYFPGRLEPNYLLVAGLDLDRADQEMKVSAYLGGGENIYATENHLYVAVTDYQAGESQTEKRILPDSESIDVQTMVYKFTLEEGEVKYAAQGEVPGTVLNQFSMDEHKGYFRIATTKGDTWQQGENTSKNNVYILNEKMKITGKIEDIAPGEKIYSARFMGDRGYLVTFKKVDPLFVIDLKNPEEPKILGALKIPGYSDYLHPYDENHIIGFGKDTIELSQKDGTGKELGTTAFYQGMKIALFDVSDVAHPVQKFQEIIGDRGTDSDLLHNHKALLFSREKNLMAFPVTVMEVKNKSAVETNIPAYGEFVYQGAYVYKIDLKDGFQLKGTITHLDDQDRLKAGYDWYSSNKNVERIIYIGDTLYTLSQGMIKAHDLDSLKEINQMIIPQ